jgi:VanZ family protein
MTRRSILRVFRFLSFWLFWPGVALIIWGELTPREPDLVSAIFGWDKLEHFTAYFGLASMATLVMGLRRKLAWALAGIIFLGGALEMIQGYVGRDCDIFDFTANTIGVFCGLGVALLFLRVFDPLVAAGRPD